MASTLFGWFKFQLYSHSVFLSLFPISALNLNCRRGLNIFRKDVSAVVNVIVHSCKELISEATCSLGLPAHPAARIARISPKVYTFTFTKKYILGTYISYISYISAFVRIQAL